MGKKSSSKRKTATSPSSHQHQQPPTKRVKRAEPERPYLPSEIWLQVSQDLVLSDKVSLALTSRYHYNLLGHDALRQLRKPSQHEERLKFLFGSYEFFPGRTLCKECLTYHDTAHVAFERHFQNQYHDDWPLYLTEYLKLTWAQVQVHAQTLRHKAANGQVPLMELQRGVSTVDALKKEINDGWTLQIHCGLDENNRFIMAIEYRRPISVDILQNPHGARLPWMCMHCDGAPQLHCELENACEEVPLPWETNDLSLYAGTLHACTFCASEFIFEVAKIIDPKLKAQKLATHDLFLTRLIDLGELYTPHSREWTAATSGYKEGVFEFTPFDQQGRPAILRRFVELVTRADACIEAGGVLDIDHGPCLPDADAAEELVMPLLTEYTFNRGLNKVFGNPRANGSWMNGVPPAAKHTFLRRYARCRFGELDLGPWTGEKPIAEAEVTDFRAFLNN